MASEAVQRDSYRQHLYNAVLVKRTRLQLRNEERRMWSLVAKRDIRVGEFIGIQFTRDPTLAARVRLVARLGIGWRIDWVFSRIGWAWMMGLCGCGDCSGEWGRGRQGLVSGKRMGGMQWRG